MDEASVGEADVRGMVAHLRPEWDLRESTVSDHGTDFVCYLTVDTGDGRRRAVLKATTADLVDPVIARSEPRLLELVGRETTVPVPKVFGYADDHPDYPAPFYLMEHVEGENFEGRPRELPREARDWVVREAGENLAELHELGPLPAVGRIGVANGELAVLDTDEHPRYDDFREHLLDNALDAAEELLDGGWFPEKAEEPERFADLVPDLRSYLEETIPALPEPDPPTCCHWDYRYGNLLVDPRTGETRAVLDWANLSAAEPAYNLTKLEANLFDPAEDGQKRAGKLQDRFRTAYAGAREDWAFDPEVRERMRVYRLTDRIDRMACLPLWMEDATAEERDRRERQHREFLAEYL